MASNSQNMRNRNNNRKQNQVNLVSARSRSNSEANKLSRLNAADGYSELRRKRATRKNIAVAVTITLSAVLIAVLAGGVAYAILNGKLATDFSGKTADFNSSLWQDTFVKPAEPEAPFWMLLMGTDEMSEPGYGRTDTLILVRVDQANKTAAMLSIPRDTYVTIPGYGKDKINAAYSYGEQEQEGGGAPLAIKTVSEFTGVPISYFAQVSFEDVENLVDGLGGVSVDVPVDIIGDRDAGALDIYAGYQKLNGEQALIFCRSRAFDNGDYQRQANQRTFLQATAKQILASDPPTIATTVYNLAEMTFTNMDIAKIVKVAQGMQGLQESGIHTYSVPSTTDMINEISYVLADKDELDELIAQIESGNYPPPQGEDKYYTGVVPAGYVAGALGTGTTSTNVQASTLTIDVRNGCGIDGCATAVSDKLVLGGYKRGAIGNTDAYIYPTTLVIYKDNTDQAAENRVAANDIKTRLGFGKVIPSEGRYTFEGNILVVVGDDFTG